MGGCASTRHRNPPPLAAKPHTPLAGSKRKRTHLSSPAAKLRPPAAVKVICEGGSVAEFDPPVTAADAAAAVAGDGYLCSWESMYVDTCPPEVSPAAELTPAQVYFVMPRCKAKEPLSLHEMCGLAIKASSGFSLVEFCSSVRD